MVMYVRDAGVWKQVGTLSSRGPSVWSPASAAYVRDAGVWKNFLVPPATIEYRATYANGSNASSYSFSSCDIGTASADRIVVVGVHLTSGTNTSYTTVTIAGTTAPQRVYERVSNINNAVVGIHSLSVTSGTTATIEVSGIPGGNPASNCGISIFVIRGALSDVPTATNVASGSSGVLSPGVTVDGGGVGVSIVAIRSNTNRTVTWADVTENYDQNLETGIGTMSGGSTSTSGSRSITATMSGTYTAAAATSAAFR